jgi:hypothetical protein
MESLMYKTVIISDIDERVFIEKLDEIFNTKKVENIEFNQQGSIKTALIITKEGSNDRKTKSRRQTSRSGVSPKSN